MKIAYDNLLYDTDTAKVIIEEADEDKPERKNILYKTPGNRYFVYFGAIDDIVTMTTEEAKNFVGSCGNLAKYVSLFGLPEDA